MDDNIIEHYTNQSAFLIDISEPVAGQFQVTLSEVWESPGCLFEPWFKSTAQALQQTQWMVETKEN